MGIKNQQLLSSQISVWGDKWSEKGKTHKQPQKYGTMWSMGVSCLIWSSTTQMIKIETLPAVSRNGILKKAEAICGNNKWNMTSSCKKQLLDYEACLPFVCQRVVNFLYYFISYKSPFFPLSFSLSLPPSLTHTHTHKHTHTHHTVDQW